MKILRQNNYSKSELKKTRVGIGWLTDTMGKNEAEETFRDINQQIEKDYEKGKSKEEIIENAEKAGKRSVAKRDIPKHVKSGLVSGVPAAAITYAATRDSKLRNNLLEKSGLNLNDQKVNKVLKKLSKHKGKLTAGVGIGAAAIELSKKKNIPTTIKKSKSAKNAGKRTAEERTKHMTED